MADTLVLEASAAMRGGSSPSIRTKCSGDVIGNRLCLRNIVYGFDPHPEYQR